jgi:hypothetical protein
MRTLIFLAFLLSGLVVTFSLASCAGYLPPTINLRTDGVTEHIDFENRPLGCDPATAAACYEVRSDGSKHIWRSSWATQQQIEHEDSHALVMRHSEWQREWNNQVCATVKVSGGKYIKGQTICITHRGEVII